MTDGLPVASRAAPPVVVPLEHDGVRYAPDDAVGPGPGRPRGGYLAAFDIASGEKLWSALVYEIRFDPGAPFHPCRYFRALTVLPDGAGIGVEDEYGVRYAFDLATRTARALPVQPARR